MDRAGRTQALGRVRVMAAGQHHVALLRELLGAGLTRSQIEGLVASGWFQRLHKGVYFVGPGTPSEWQRAVAGWMAVGPRAVVSHSTAARLHRVPHVLPDPVPELTVAVSRHPRPAGTWTHRVHSLHPTDVERRDGVPLTAAPRTLVDVSPRLSPDLLARVIDEGAIARLWTPETLMGARRRVAGRNGLGVLDRLLRQRVGSPVVDSHLEARTAAALRGIGPFETQHHVVLDGRVVVIDLALPSLKLAVESDGWAVRDRSRGKFDRDRRKDNLLVSHGWTVVHLTSAMSDDEMRRAVVDVMMRLVARRGPEAVST